jgi:hypothetical protein
LSVTAYSPLFATWELVPCCLNNGATLQRHDQMLS